MRRKEEVIIITDREKEKEYQEKTYLIHMRRKQETLIEIDRGEGEET